jgi:hypothetical protein
MSGVRLSAPPRFVYISDTGVDTVPPAVVSAPNLALPSVALIPNLSGGALLLFMTLSWWEAAGSIGAKDVRSTRSMGLAWLHGHAPHGSATLHLHSMRPVLHIIAMELLSLTAYFREFWLVVGPGGKLHPAYFLEHKGHLVVEGLLLLVILYLFLQHSFKPKARAEDPLTDKVRSAIERAPSAPAPARSCMGLGTMQRGAVCACMRTAY